MTDQTLRAISPLECFRLIVETTEVREITQLAIISIATPSAGHEFLDSLLEKTIGLRLPTPGKIERHGTGLALLGLQRDQCFMVSQNEQVNPAHTLKSKLKEAAYLSDQSDSWVVVEIDGPLSRSALERICPLDLTASKFSKDDVARTSMEHLSVIIERPAADLYRLYSPRSSAHSFLHSITQSVYNVSDD